MIHILDNQKTTVRESFEETRREMYRSASIRAGDNTKLFQEIFYYDLDKTYEKSGVNHFKQVTFLQTNLKKIENRLCSGANKLVLSKRVILTRKPVFCISERLDSDESKD